MFQAPYIENQKTDATLPNLIDMIRDKTIQGGDDALIILVGRTGTGKSHLGLHIYDMYCSEPDCSQVCLTMQELAIGHRRCEEMFEAGTPGRFLFYDEASVLRREALSKRNRDLLRLYSSNRVFGILHLWANPSLEQLDLPFIKERVSAVIFVNSKDKVRPRTYFFYTKESLLQMLARGITLSHHELQKSADRYATYRGWFRKYEGQLLEDYNARKKAGSLQIAHDFYDKYGIKSFTMVEASQALGVSQSTVKKLDAYAISTGQVSANEIIGKNRHHKYQEKHLELYKKIILSGELDRERANEETKENQSH